MIRDAFELQACPPATVKGVEGPIAYHLVLVSGPTRPGWGWAVVR